jgi:hypothetical protein
MRKSKALLVVGLSAAALLGLAGFAAAQSHARTHVLTVRLPDGSLEQIRYTGDVAPRVVVSAQAAPVVMANPVAAPFDWNAPFALLDQISAQMDRQSQAMMREIDALAMPGAGMAAFGGPAFDQGLSFASSITGNGTCGHSVEVTQSSQGKAVVRRTWGDCAKTPAAKAPAQSATSQTAAAHPVQAKAAEPAKAQGAKLSI